jgi:hypothetical protein
MKALRQRGGKGLTAVEGGVIKVGDKVSVVQRFPVLIRPRAVQRRTIA